MTNRLPLPDDMLLYLSRYHLGERDRLALAFSGANERFPLLYGTNRRQLVLPQCYFITSTSWKSFFQQNIDPLLITTFDVSSCYWLPAQVLCKSLKQMVNVEELYIQDTEISLAHLPRVFRCCKKIVKLSFTLMEKTLDQYHESVMGTVSFNWMRNGFQRLTHLKVFTFALNKNYCCESWMVTLGVLIWCRDCIDLLIEIAYAKPIDSNFGFICYRDMEIAAQAEEELFPHLGWMRSLKSLVVHRRGSFFEPNDRIVVALVDFVLRFPDPVSLERLWISEFNFDIYLSETDMTGPIIKSLTTNTLEDDELDELVHDRFRHLEHYSGYKFRRYEQLSNLKYFRGNCFSQQDVGMIDFCESHPLLEELHFHTSSRNALDGDWKLLALKVLVYRCFVPYEENIARIIEAFPNLQRLHIGNDCWISRAEDVGLMINFFSVVNFPHLTWLTFSGFRLTDGTMLPSISERCPKLKRLHLNGRFEAHTLFSHEGERLPLATNLLDLRLQCLFGIKNASEVLALLKPTQHMAKIWTSLDHRKGCRKRGHILDNWYTSGSPFGRFFRS